MFALQDAQQLLNPQHAPKTFQLSAAARQHRKLLQTSQAGPLEAFSSFLRHLGLGRNGNEQKLNAAVVQKESEGSSATLEQGFSPDIAASVPLASSASMMQQGIVVVPQSSVTYTTTTYTSISPLPAEASSSSTGPAFSYSSSMGSAMGNAVPGPLTQRAGVAGTLIGAAGDTIGQFKADKAAAQAAFVSSPGSTGHTIVTNTGAIQGELLSGGGHMLGQAVSALGQAGDYATGVTRQVASNLGVGTGGLFNMAGRFVSSLAQLTGPGRNVATKTGKLEYISPYSSRYYL